MLTFDPKRQYTRQQVMVRAGLSPLPKGGDWYTGIVEHEGEFIIFANVGTEGRTGHDYDNRWEGERLRWFHRGRSHLGWKSVQRLISPGARVHVFWRDSNRAPFTYAGTGRVVGYFDTSPVKIIWDFDVL